MMSLYWLCSGGEFNYDNWGCSWLDCSGGGSIYGRKIKYSDWQYCESDRISQEEYDVDGNNTLKNWVVVWNADVFVHYLRCQREALIFIWYFLT